MTSTTTPAGIAEHDSSAEIIESLACEDCDTEECVAYGSAIVPPGWTEVHRYDGRESEDLGVWWTHLGVCPLCRRERAVRAAEKQGKLF